MAGATGAADAGRLCGSRIPVGRVADLDKGPGGHLDCRPGQRLQHARQHGRLVGRRGLDCRRHVWPGGSSARTVFRVGQSPAVVDVPGQPLGISLV